MARYLATLATFFAIAISLMVMGSFIPGFWLTDLLSQLRLLYAILLVICFIQTVLSKSKKLASGLAVIFLLNAWPILVLINKDQPPARTHQTLSILNFNTEFQHNDNYAAFIPVIKERDADILCLVEVDDKWIEGLKAATDNYHYQKIVIKGAGLALFSKLPLENIAVRYFGKSHHPRIFATIKINEQLLTLVIIHPTTPQSERGWAERNEEFAIIRDEIRALDTPAILVGDFNCGPWSPAFATLTQTPLYDSEHGYFPEPSWPARPGRAIPFIPIPPLIPIDHVLFTPGIEAVERLAGPAVGSDHMPVFVRLKVP